MLPAAHLSHATADRARLKIPSARGRAGYFSRVEERLARLRGVRGVSVNPRTASVLVIHGTTVGELAAFGEREELFRLAERSDGRADQLPELLLAGFGVLDGQLRALSGSSLDLRAVSLLALLGIGVEQLLRGNVAVPAATAFWYAATLLMMSSGGAWGSKGAG